MSINSKWLIGTCLISSLTGWLISVVLSGDFGYWLFLWLFIFSFILTMNEDNLIESIFTLVILGVCTAVIGYYDPFPSIVGRVSLFAFYISLAMSKIIFALAKSGALGNTRFDEI